MKWRILDSGFNTGKLNMEVDIKLAESCSPDEAVLRFYRWNPYCISLGANQNINELNVAQAEHDKINVVFRPTGGRAILHAEELTYSVIYPVDENISFRNIYHEINLALIEGLINYSPLLSLLELENIQPNFPNFYKEQMAALCFAVPAKSEIKYSGKKLVGSAQKKMKHALLQHGSILCGDYHLKILDYLHFPQEKITFMKEELSNKTTDLYSILGATIDYSRLTESLVKGFHDHFRIDMEFIVQEETATYLF
jgi:lipoyl(octanoyl) transferase